MKVKQGNAYEKLGHLIEGYSKHFEKEKITGKEEYLELPAEEFKKKAASFGLTEKKDYELEETTVRLYPYSDSVLRLKIPDLEVIKKMREPSVWPLPGFFDKAYDCDRDVNIAGVDDMPPIPSEAEKSLEKIKAEARCQSKPLTGNQKEIEKAQKVLRLELSYEELGWYSITNCG